MLLVSAHQLGPEYHHSLPKPVPVSIVTSGSHDTAVNDLNIIDLLMTYDSKPVMY